MAGGSILNFSERELSGKDENLKTIIVRVRAMLTLTLCINPKYSHSMEMLIMCKYFTFIVQLTIV